MDGESFDRLSVEIHRLRERVTRRGALGLLLGGAAAAAFGTGADEADARRRRRRKKKCRNFGGRCNHNGDCCGNSRCRNGFCFPRGGGGGGGGGSCNDRDCPNGWECCRQWSGGVEVCVPRDHPSCFNNGECPFGWDHCGWNGPIRRCCSLDSYCCHDAFGGPICLPDGADCDDFSREARTSDVEGTEPIPVTEIDPAEFE